MARSRPRAAYEASLRDFDPALCPLWVVHMIVPGGGLSMDGSRWVVAKPRFFLPVRVLAKLFRRLMPEKLVAAHDAGMLQQTVSLLDHLVGTRDKRLGHFNA
jgi:hypothetical protein